MTDRRDEEHPYKETENPVEELMEGFERMRWRPARSPWGEAERRMREKEERREELMKAWRSRRVRPASDEPGDSSS